MERSHPQTTFEQTTIETDSFFGKIRRVYIDKVLKTQLEQLRRQGSYDAFKLCWHPTYEIRRTVSGAAKRPGENPPPSLFWESDIGKWIEAVCYFLSSTDGQSSPCATEYKACVDELVDMIVSAQQDDGYLNIYFTVVDKEGRLKNLRDLHEMYNAGHLLEGALAHYHYTGSRKFLNVMIKNIDFFRRALGTGPGQQRGYPGHPEIELALLRLAETTKEPRFAEFAEYLLSERGMGGGQYYKDEAVKRNEIIGHLGIADDDLTYWQAHQPLKAQRTILGHSVRAFYLTTAAADLGGEYRDAASRLLTDAVRHKMYVTGGFGSEPHIEGFSAVPYWLPQSTEEGGCYAETCASIACMMTCERILSYPSDSSQSDRTMARETLELCLYNAVLGGGSLDGTQFAYANKLTTCGDESAIRKDWFEVCCCPPNLSRTLGILGGYIWSARETPNVIELDVYLFASASRQISGHMVSMVSEMPWQGRTRFEFSRGIEWHVRVPGPSYAVNPKISVSTTLRDGFYHFSSTGGTVTLEFDMPVRLLASHPRTGRDTLAVSRGPIVYTAESVDNVNLSERHPHFGGLAINTRDTPAIKVVKQYIQGIEIVQLELPVWQLEEYEDESLWRERGRTYTMANETLVLVPWFSRGNKGGTGQVRTCFDRVP